MICPLTRWEVVLRAELGTATYSDSSVHYWLHSLLDFTLPECVFGGEHAIGSLVCGEAV